MVHVFLYFCYKKYMPNVRRGTFGKTERSRSHQSWAASARGVFFLQGRPWALGNRCVSRVFLFAEFFESCPKGRQLPLPGLFRVLLSKVICYGFPSSDSIECPFLKYKLVALHYCRTNKNNYTVSHHLHVSVIAPVIRVKQCFAVHERRWSDQTE